MEPQEKYCNKKGFGVRHVQALLLFLCLTIGGGLNAPMNVGFLAMTDKNSTKNETIYDWDKQTHDYIMSTFFWGEIIVLIITCTVIHKFGGKSLLFFGLCLKGTGAIVIPTVAAWGGWKAMFAASMVQCMGSGFISPACHTLLGKWAPLYERTTIQNFVLSAYYLTMVVSFPLAAWTNEAFGWPWIFYLFGGKAIAAGLVWGCFGANSPAEHRTISCEERRYIEESLEQNDKEKIKNTPWKAILTSKPVLILIIAQSGAQWGYNVMFIELAAYFNLALGLDLQKSSILISVSYLIAMCFEYVSGWVSDYLTRNKYCSITSMRKICNTIATWGSSLCLIIITLIPNKTAIILLIFAAVGIDGIKSGGFCVTHLDLSPNHAGILISMATIVSDFVSLLAPLSTGYILDDPHDMKQWNKVFQLAALIYFVGNLIFILFGEAKKQPWDKAENLENDEKLRVKLTDGELETMEPVE